MLPPAAKAKTHHRISSGDRPRALSQLHKTQKIISSDQEVIVRQYYWGSTRVGETGAGASNNQWPRADGGSAVDIIDPTSDIRIAGKNEGFASRLSNSQVLRGCPPRMTFVLTVLVPEVLVALIALFPPRADIGQRETRCVRAPQCPSCGREGQPLDAQCTAQIGLNRGGCRIKKGVISGARDATGAGSAGSVCASIEVRRRVIPCHRCAACKRGKREKSCQNTGQKAEIIGISAIEFVGCYGPEVCLHKLG